MAVGLTLVYLIQLNELIANINTYGTWLAAGDYTRLDSSGELGVANKHGTSLASTPPFCVFNIYPKNAANSYFLFPPQMLICFACVLPTARSKLGVRTYPIYETDNLKNKLEAEPCLHRTASFPMPCFSPGI